MDYLSLLLWTAASSKPYCPLDTSTIWKGYLLFSYKSISQVWGVDAISLEMYKSVQNTCQYDHGVGRGLWEGTEVGFGGAGEELQGLCDEAMRLVEAWTCNTHLGDAWLPEL